MIFKLAFGLSKNFIKRKGCDEMQIGEYVVKPNCIRDENALIRFLESNGFEYADDFENNPLNREYLILINVIQRTYFRIDRYGMTGEPMSAEDFYLKVRYHPRNKIVHRKLYSEEGRVHYEGYTLEYSPYGLGTAYYTNGNKYQEGIFDIKGLVEGKEYYSNGQVKFEGIWSITMGYGPNAPRAGNYYDEDGNLLFSGRFEIKKGGVGYPMIKHPRNYRIAEKDRPKIDYR